MLDKFPLIYVRKSDNRICYVKRLLLGEYKVREGLDSKTEKKISKHELKKNYTFQERISMSNVRERTEVKVRKLA